MISTPKGITTNSVSQSHAYATVDRKTKVKKLNKLKDTESTVNTPRTGMFINEERTQ